MGLDTKKNDLRTYQIRFCGQVDDDFVISYCPPGLAIARDGGVTTLSNIQTDQSGILGLVRYLHNLGCTILALTC